MTPESIAYHSKSKILELSYADGSNANLTAEYLRVFSPSAECADTPSPNASYKRGKNISKSKISNLSVTMPFELYSATDTIQVSTHTTTLLNYEINSRSTGLNTR